MEKLKCDGTLPGEYNNTFEVNTIKFIPRSIIYSPILSVSKVDKTVQRTMQIAEFL